MKNNTVVLKDDSVDDRKISKAHVQLVRAALKQLVAEHGDATAKQLLELARPKKSPLHALFDWDDSNAGEKYRLQQAGTFIRCVRFRILTEQGIRVVPEHISVFHEPGRRAYVPTLQVMSDPELAEQALAEAREAYLRLRNRYAMLRSLAPIHAAIDETLDKKK